VSRNAHYHDDDDDNTDDLVKLRCIVPKVGRCSPRDRQTDRQTHRNTWHPYRSRV